MLIIILVIIGLSLLILGHEAGHFFAAKLFGIRVNEFGFGFPPRIASKKIGETEYSLNWLPFGGFVKLAGERGEFAMVEPDGGNRAKETARKTTEEQPDQNCLLHTQPAWKKSVVMLAGVFMNFLLGWFFLSLTLMIGAPKALVVSGVQPNSPAVRAGIMEGDIIKDFTTAQSFIHFVDAHRGQEIAIMVIRNNKELNFNVVPRVTTAPDEGAVGVLLVEAGQERKGFFTALREGFINALTLIWLTVQALYELVRQLVFRAALLPGVVGPVGIVSIAEETGKIGLVYLLQFLGVISLNLTVVNLIPFPALDGGRFLLTIIEKIKGSPLSFKIEALVNGLGFALLILLMVLLTVRDVGGLL